MTDQFMVTHSGVEIDPFDPHPDQIVFKDIAWALSNLARFTGHGPFYSVAQHSIIVASFLETELVAHDTLVAGLLHDAAEAYVGDMAAPLKSRMPAYQEVENRILRVIFQKFGVPYPASLLVEYADKMVLATERRDILTQGVTPWKVSNDYRPLDIRITPWNPHMSYFGFMQVGSLLGIPND